VREKRKVHILGLVVTGMGLFDSTRVLAGIALMVVGSLLFLPAVYPISSQLFTYALVLGTALLTLGTWLVGTSEGGPAV
jgi:Ca2+/Na+ antiporter